MARVAPRVPELTDVLCERCGYVLNGLPADGRCPECGTPVAESVGDGRVPTAWDAAEPRRAPPFVATAIEVIRRPRHFYRTLATRASVASARSFAQLNWWLAALLFGAAGAAHAVFYWGSGGSMRPLELTPVAVLTYAGLTLGFAIGVYLTLDGVTRLAARLTNWEATYRGLRLPYAAVLRGLYYHSPHYLPVAVLTAVTVIGFQVLLAVHPAAIESAPTYLFVLCGEVIFGAVYLFQTYWIGMRNMMYANR